MIPLHSNDYYKVSNLLLAVPVNNLFARAVVEHHVDGIVMVDDITLPRTVLVLHPYGMSLLFGDTSNENFKKEFKEYALNIDGNRKKVEWLQASPEWDKVLDELFAGSTRIISDNKKKEERNIIELQTRVNFKFNVEKYQQYISSRDTLSIGVVRTSKEIFHDMKGTVIPTFFWKNSDHFMEKSIGFTALKDGKIGSTAYAAFIIDNYLEIGIETIEEFRGNKLAQYACSSLIDYALNNNFEPVWACRLENASSYFLAQKLGFEPTVYRPYYKLPSTN